MSRTVLFTGALLLVAITCGETSARTLEFHTTQVTGASVALSPDGQILAFTILGHLFSMPAGGGSASQLTFGPCYDDSPSFSPDGSQVAFTSDRDGSEGNIFVLDLKSHQIRQITHEMFASREVWSPDGKSIVYLRLSSRMARELRFVAARIGTQGGQPETLSPTPKQMGQPFYLSTARLAWTIIERDSQSAQEITRVEELDAHGTSSTLMTIPGVVDGVVPSPGGDGYYCHRVTGAGGFNPGREEVVFIPSTGSPERQIVPVTRMGRFTRAPDGMSLYMGDQGHIWKVGLPDGQKTALTFGASVKLEVREISEPTPATSPASNQVRAITTPRLSPDGRTLVFGAAGFLWKQSLDGSEAKRISRDMALESDPAFSPDGRFLAYARAEYGEQSLQVLDLATGKTRVPASVPGLSQLSWSLDGESIVGVANDRFGSAVVRFHLEDGRKERLVAAGLWSPRPQLSADGRAVYYSADTTGVGNLHRLSLTKDAKATQVTHFLHHLSNARLSPDEHWLLFRRNQAILIASLADGPVTDRDTRELATEGGDSFAITQDGSSVIYAAGGHVWLQPLPDGPRREIPLRLDLPRAPATPLLIRGVRILDFHSGAFGPLTALLIRDGRIEKIGDAAMRRPPTGTATIDAGGRFAIPGLFDLHVHSQTANPEAFLAYGVTSLRDTGGSALGLGALQDRSNLTNLPLPRYYYSGEIFEGEHPYWGDGFFQIDNEKDARAYVRRLKDAGASFIKVYPSLPWPLKRVVADEAHRSGLPIVGHGTSTEEIIKSVTSGFFSVEHNTGVNRIFDDIIHMLAESGTRWDPTVTLEGGDALLLREEPERLTETKFQAFTPPSYIDFARSFGYFKMVPTGELRGFVASQLAAIGLARRSGVRLLVGTDAPNPEIFFGSSLHWELERFVEAGLSPLDVIRLATQEAAETVGAADLGTIQEGRLADLVLLDASPLDNIRNTQQIWRVIKDGRLFDPGKLKNTASSLPVADKSTSR